MDVERYAIKTKWTGKNDPFVRNAIELANYQMNVRKKVIKVIETDKAVQKKSTEYKKEVISDFTDWTYGCMALAMHRVYGWGAKRLSRMLEELEVIRAELIDQNMDSSQIWDLVRQEVKLDITVVTTLLLRSLPLSFIYVP